MVLVSYADYLRMNSIDPISVAEIAYRVGANGVMIDTRIKDEENVFLKKFVSLAKNIILLQLLLEVWVLNTYVEL